MPAVRVTIKLYPVQADFIHSAALFRGFVGGRGAGKSFVGSYDLIRRAKPGRLYMVVAPTYKVLKDATFRTFAEHCRNMHYLKKLNRADLRATLGNGAEVLFRSAENPDSLRGPNISGCWMDEASYCVEEAYTVVIACLREAGEQGWLTATFTPKGKQHWTYKILGKNIEAIKRNTEAGAEVERIDPNFALFTASTKDNPFLPAEFEGVLRGQYTSQMQRQELEGAFLDSAGKLFDRGWFTQILKAPPAQARWVRYWDKAATQGAGCHTCGVLMGADYTGKFYIADVLRGQWSTFTRDEIILQTARLDASRFNYNVRIFIEQEPGSGGVDSLRATIQKLVGFPAFGDRPSIDKRVRAEPFAAQAEAGNVILVDPPGSRQWINEYLDELDSFPDGKAMDQIDATSGAFNRLTEGSTAMPTAGGTPGPAQPPPAGGDGKQQTASEINQMQARNMGLQGIPGTGSMAPLIGRIGGPSGGGFIGMPGRQGSPGGLLGLPTKQAA